MALGETIGYGARLTENNDMALYSPTNYGADWVHVSLMGDPTLRTDYILQADSLSIASLANMGATISWKASPDAAVIGYYVYRSDSAWGAYDRISSLIPAGKLGRHQGCEWQEILPGPSRKTAAEHLREAITTWENGIVDSANGDLSPGHIHHGYAAGQYLSVSEPCA